MKTLTDFFSEMLKDFVIEAHAFRNYEKLSKDIKELFSASEFIELVKEKYNEIERGK